jgi:Mrp family chromosome partitioning ATPase
MTRLDQAFIKVYTQQRKPLPAPQDCPAPGSPPDAPDDQPPEHGCDAPMGVSIDGVLEALQTTAARIGELLPSEKTAQAPAGDDTDRHDVTYRVDAGPPTRSAASGPDGQTVRPPHMQLPGGDAPEANDVAADPVDSPDEASGLRPDHPSGGAREAFQPMLQVDRFTWPAVCRRLDEAAPEELDRLADGLVDVMARGNSVVAVAGCRRGEGATTLLLCAGRRLAELGLNVLLADADLADPQLARRLGLSPQSGWEDVLTGRLPLEEVVIESVGDRLAVLPVCRALAKDDDEEDEQSEDETRLAESLQTLSAHYDLVLLDPGPMEELGAVGGSLARSIGSRLDAIALVHHAGVTPPEDLDEVRCSLAASEIVEVGVIENFVRD